MSSSKTTSLVQFSSTCYRLLYSFLNGCSQVVRFGGELSTRRNLSCGLGQGIILAPTLFCLFIDDLHSRIYHTAPHFFVDDCQLLVSGPKPDAAGIVDLINDDMQNIFLGLDQMGCW
jgi:hypothetical protein